MPYNQSEREQRASEQDTVYKTSYPDQYGKVVYTLKTPYRDGTTRVAFDGVLACAARPKPPLAEAGHPSQAG